MGRACDPHSQTGLVNLPFQLLVKIALRLSSADFRALCTACRTTYHMWQLAVQQLTRAHTDSDADAGVYLRVRIKESFRAHIIEFHQQLGAKLAAQLGRRCKVWGGLLLARLVKPDHQGHHIQSTV